MILYSFFNSESLVYPARSANGPHIGNNALAKDQFEYWPIFKQEDTSRNKSTKRKLYSHLVVRFFFKFIYKI